MDTIKIFGQIIAWYDISFPLLFRGSEVIRTSENFRLRGIVERNWTSRPTHLKITNHCLSILDCQCKKHN